MMIPNQSGTCDGSGVIYENLFDHACRLFFFPHVSYSPNA